ncbi:putative membrane protein [Trueperella bonasi]|uniref:Membrane protein n=1 Tax=Trueperella bonasi TaxID=312286 RepID=A0ABT9NHB9_9ACTO|nr:heparan-alpha-glucosaminide N-acetyltransferase domain-containing protein [Trueperella bonasi]MDP9806398.1 putative membrane protein [Trueperella bonasi]
MESTADNPHTAPVSTRYSGRIRGLDLARGIAIIGMIWAHVKPLTDDDGLAHLLSEIPSGRSSALFALLAGVSIAILTGRNAAYSGERMRHAQLRIAGRAIMLFIFAGILELFSTPIAIILDFYALWFLLSIPFVHWSARRLAVSALVVAFVGPQLIIGFQWLTESMALWGSSILTDTLITGTYPGLAYMALVFAGMALGRLDLTQVLLRWQLLIVGVCLAVLGYGAAWVATNSFAPEEPGWNIEYGIGGSGFDIDDGIYKSDLDLPSFEVLSGELPSFDVDVAEEPAFAEPGVTLFDFFNATPHSNTTPEVLGNLGVGLAIISLCLWLSPLARHVLYPVAAVGSLSLTAYFGHAFFLHFNENWFFGESVVPFFWLAGGALIFCTLWCLLPLRRGPLEWLTWKFSQWFARPSVDRHG